MINKRRLLGRVGALVFGFLFWSIAPPLQALSQDLSQEIEALISMRHPTDTRETWTRLGPEAPQVIKQMLESTQSVPRRMRLIQGLAWFDSPENTEVIKNEIQQSANIVVRQNGIRTLGVTQGPKESAYLIGFLIDADPQTRLTAAEVLRKMTVQKQEILGALQEFEATEKVDWVKSKYNRAPHPKPIQVKGRSTQEGKPMSGWIGKWQGSFQFAGQVPGQSEVSKSAAQILSRNCEMEIKKPAKSTQQQTKQNEESLSALSITVQCGENDHYEWQQEKFETASLIGLWRKVFKGIHVRPQESPRQDALPERVTGVLSLESSPQIPSPTQHWIEFSTRTLPFHGIFVPKPVQ